MIPSMASRTLFLSVPTLLTAAARTVNASKACPPNVLGSSLNSPMYAER